MSCARMIAVESTYREAPTMLRNTHVVEQDHSCSDRSRIVIRRCQGQLACIDYICTRTSTSTEWRFRVRPLALVPKKVSPRTCVRPRSSWFLVVTASTQSMVYLTFASTDVVVSSLSFQ